MRTFILFLGLFASFSAHAQKITKVESFTPTGVVGSAEQVHIRFSDFIFPLGETDHEAPLISACDQYGEGRWLNPKEWVFDFKQTLPPMIHCEYKLRAGLKSQKGVPVIASSDAYYFELSPAELERTEPYGTKSISDISKETAQSGGIDPDQNFVLIFNCKYSL